MMQSVNYLKGCLIQYAKQKEEEVHDIKCRVRMKISIKTLDCIYFQHQIKYYYHTSQIQLIKMSHHSSTINIPASPHPLRRSQRHKNKRKSALHFQYSIPNPFQLGSIYPDLPLQLIKQLCKFEKLSMHSLQKINFNSVQAHRRQKISRSLFAEKCQQNLLSKMKLLVEQQQKKYEQLNICLQEYPFSQKSSINNQQAIIKQRTSRNDDKRQIDNDDERQIDNNNLMMSQNQSQELGNILHENYSENNQFLLYSDQNYEDHIIEHGFLKEEFDQYLI